MKKIILILIIILLVIVSCSKEKENKQQNLTQKENQTIQLPYKDNNISVKEDDIKEEEKEQQKSITEQYLEEFNSKIKHYDFIYNDPSYGALYILVEKDEGNEKYEIIPYEDLLEIKDGILKKTNYDAELRSESLIQNIREEEVKAINYLVIDKESKVGKGCVVLERFFSLENCIYKNPEERDKQIIYDNLKISPFPKLPEDWLIEYRGKSFIEKKENNLYKDNSRSYNVEYLFFKNNDNTMTKMYIHSTYKIPLAVEILKDNEISKRYVYEGFTPNRHNIMEWRKLSIPYPSEE